MTMTTTQDGIGTYEITIPGRDAIRVEGTQAQAWERVDREMRTAPAGTIPIVRQVTAAPIVRPAAPTVTAPTTHADAMRRGVDTDGAARSTTDLLAAQAAGFAPARPYYDRGTPVIGLGVQNARASHREWSEQPRLGDAVSTFCDHIASENRRDELIQLGVLAMHTDGSLTGQKPGERWQVEPEALSQLATRLGVPAPGFLVSTWPELRARCWNQYLATALAHARSTCPADHPIRQKLDGEQTIRARLRNGSGPTSLWAVVSDSYVVYDVDKIASALALGLRDYPEARCEVEYNGRTAKLDVLFHSNVEPERYVAGEFFKAGLRVRTSDAGGGSVHVSLLLWQNLCLNLLCIDVASFTLARLRHIGSAEVLAERFAKSVRDGERQLGHFLRAWGFATEDALCSGDKLNTDALRLLDECDADATFTESEILTGIFRGLGQSDAVSIGRDDLPGLLAAHALDTSSARQLAPVTRASVVNAITRYAHTDVGRRDPGKQAELESQAGALLVGGRGGKPAALPFLPLAR